MALSNAEKQRRHRARLAERHRTLVATVEQLSLEVARLHAEADRLRASAPDRAKPASFTMTKEPANTET